MRIFWALLKVLLVAIAAVVVLAIAFFVILRPPKQLEVHPQGATIAGVTVINPGMDRHTNQTVVVSGSIIESIADAGPAPADSRYAGAYVLPGLIDMHVHNPPPMTPDFQYFLLMYLRYGVTAVRDTGNDGFMFKMRGRLLKGELAGPRAFTSGPILDGDPPVWPFSKVVRTPADADRVVAELAADGADFVKVYEHLTPDALHEIEAEAHRRHLPVVGHVPELVKFEDAHIDDVQHLTGTTDIPRRIYDQFPELIVAGSKGWHDMDDARIAFVVKTSLAQHVTHTPTMVVLDRTSRPDYNAQASEPDAMLMPRWYREVFWKRTNYGFTPEALAALESYGSPMAKIKLMVRRMHEAGVPLHVGTDCINPFVVPGESLHEEMRDFLDAGFTPEQVLVATTRDNGTGLPLADLGIVKTGAPADLLILKEDPTHDLSKLDSIEAVVTNGRLYTRDELDGALERYRTRFSSPLYERVMMTMMRFFAPRPKLKAKAS